MPKKIEKLIEKVIDSMKKKFIDRDADYVSILDGPNYPQASEVEQFMTMCQVVKENFICIHPLDDSIKKFAPKEIKT